MSDAILRVEGLKKVYRTGKSDLVIFTDLSFEVRPGEALAIVGNRAAERALYCIF